MSTDHQHHGEPDHGEAEHGHHHHGARVSTPAERELLTPFTDDLHAFLRAALQGVTGPIVEVGAGDGVIAQLLCDDGFDVVAIDGNEATAAAATEQGREVIHADWRSWDGGGNAPFAAALFTRSLHHIDPIEHATDQMARLVPGGLIVADEFGYELVDDAGAQLLVDGQAIADAAGVGTKEPVAVADPVFAWEHRMEVEHEVTPSHRLLAAVENVADVLQSGNGRFIARMLTHGLDPTHPQAAAVRDLLIAIEDARIAAGTLAPAGLRFVARVRS
ncbi:MAG: methyltransferase domain-containing protein [Actinomycetota bacterium]